MPGPWDEPTPPPAPSRKRRWIWFGVLLAGGLALLALNEIFPQGPSRLEDPYFIRLLAILVLTSSSLVLVRRIPFRQTLRYVLMWLGVAAVFIVAFSFQNELADFGTRLRGALIPSYAIQTGAREMTIAEGEDGHYHVYGTVNGVKVPFLVDTGASDIVLDPQDARRIGLNLDELKFDKPFGSANGVGHGASIEVDELSVGAIRLAKVRMSVNQVPMGSSLLGMTFLKQLKSYSFSGGKLTLRW